MNGIPDGVPTYVKRDATLRAKIIDACGMTCTFCHNEGTPVAADNRRREAGSFTGGGASGRVSIYARSNEVSFLSASMAADDEYLHALLALRFTLGICELHLTGGEPTLHQGLTSLIRVARRAGYGVCMTSNGERAAQVIPEAAQAGLDRVNFSIFGTTPRELAEVQHARFQDVAKAQRKIDALRAAIDVCAANEVQANANVVVLNESHVNRVHRLLDEFSPTLSVRLLNSLDHGQRSLDAIEQVLVERAAVPEAHYVTAGVSGARTAYRMCDGRRIMVKWIRPARLPETCADCRFNNDTDCQEGFYGVRLYRARDGRWMVGVCIQRMDLCMPLDEFADSELATEIVQYREAEYRRLALTATSVN